MAEIVYIDGEFCDRDNAKISVFDHGLLYGDGVFEGIRMYGRNIFRLEEHLKRLESSAKYICLQIPLSREKLVEAICETCRRSQLDDGYIRLIVTRGCGTLGLDPYKCENPSLIIIVSKISLYPPEFYENGLPIIVAATRRFTAEALSPRVKSLNYLNNIMAKMEAIHSNVLEALMLDQNGYIVECTGDNFFIVKNGVLRTPPIHQGALQGITRDAVLDLARKEGIKINEDRMTLYDAFEADECFLTGTAAEIIPVISIDNRTIGDGKPGKMTKLMLEKFSTITTVEGTKY